MDTGRLGNGLLAAGIAAVVVAILLWVVNREQDRLEPITPNVSGNVSALEHFWYDYDRYSEAYTACIYSFSMNNGGREFPCPASPLIPVAMYGGVLLLLAGGLLRFSIHSSP